MTKPFVTCGSREYFAERKEKIAANIGDAKAKIDAIEARVSGEIAEIQAKRDLLRAHLEGVIRARNDLAQRRERAAQLIDELTAVVAICDAELPDVDAALDQIEGDAVREDAALRSAEQSRSRQLKKHVRKQARYEMRHARLELRETLFFKDEKNEVAAETEATTP